MYFSCVLLAMGLAYGLFRNPLNEAHIIFYSMVFIILVVYWLGTRGKSN
jgi:magnesium-transporting ATPase (P-type)